MKKLTLALAFIAISLISFAQTSLNADIVMSRFQRFYNAKMDDSIRAMFSKTWGATPEKLKQVWEDGSAGGLHKDYGKIISIKYIGEMDDDPSTKLYKVVTDKDTHATGISLDEENRFLNFRFHTSSDHINKLMGKDEISQTEYPVEVFDKAMTRFQKFYNAKMDDSIANMFSDSWSNIPKSRLWGDGRCEELQKDYGTITSFKFIGEMNDDPFVKLYKVTTTKETYATGLSLDEKKQLMTFRFKTSSSHINKLMEESK